jgi:hypothetical protein
MERRIMIYQFIDSTNTVVAKIDDDGISRMSCTINNPDYLIWLSEGNRPEPADIPPVVIPDISMRQARLALLADGLLDDVEAALSTPEYKIWWEYSTVVERSNYLVNDVLKILGKSDEEIDQMFIGASQL